MKGWRPRGEDGGGGQRSSVERQHRDTCPAALVEGTGSIEAFPHPGPPLPPTRSLSPISPYSPLTASNSACPPLTVPSIPPFPAHRIKLRLQPRILKPPQQPRNGRPDVDVAVLSAVRFQRPCHRHVRQVPRQCKCVVLSSVGGRGEEDKEGGVGRCVWNSPPPSPCSTGHCSVPCPQTLPCIYRCPEAKRKHPPLPPPALHPLLLVKQSCHHISPRLRAPVHCIWPPASRLPPLVLRRQRLVCYPEWGNVTMWDVREEERGRQWRPAWVWAHWGGSTHTAQNPVLLSSAPQTLRSHLPIYNTHPYASQGAGVVEERVLANGHPSTPQFHRVQLAHLCVWGGAGGAEVRGKGPSSRGGRETQIDGQREFSA